MLVQHSQGDVIILTFLLDQDKVRDNYRVIELFRLGKTFEITESSH